MATVSFNFGTGAQGEAMGTINSVSFKPWNWTDAFRTISDTGSLAKMTDILAPLDKRTTIKVTLDKIADVYSTLAGGTVPPASRLANTAGATVFAEVNTIASKTVGETEIQLPMVARVELRLPFDADISAANVTELFLAAYGALCNDVGIPTVTTEKMRGALTPQGI